MANDGGLAKLMKKMERLQKAPGEKIDAALIRAANRVEKLQQARAPKDTGALADSIAVTKPGETTPPYGLPSGPRVAGKHEVIITAGNTDVRYAHIVQYGSSKTEAVDYFNGPFHELREQLEKNIARTGRKAIRDAIAEKESAE